MLSTAGVRARDRFQLLAPSAHPIAQFIVGRSALIEHSVSNPQAKTTTGPISIQFRRFETENQAADRREQMSAQLQEETVQGWMTKY
jgi:hypothetical protein